MSQAEQSSPLTAHTLQTLCDELVSGRAVLLDEQGARFRLRSPEARALFDWYRRNISRWSKNNTKADVEALVDQLDNVAPVIPLGRGLRGSAFKRVLHLRSLRAHRFGGLQRYGTPTRAPVVFSFEVDR